MQAITIIQIVKVEMRIYLQLIENYLKQDIPTIILTVDKQKYIFNMPTCFQRFIKDHKQKFPKGSNIFFTKVNTDTIAGLSGFMLTIFESRFCQDTKLFVSDELYQYLEQVRYKMGFKILPYSYSNLFTQETRTGIKDIKNVYELLNREDYPKIFANSEQYIKENFSAEETNESRNLLNESNQFYDGQMRIIAFGVQSKGQKIINYILIPNKLQGKVLSNKIKQLKVPPRMISKLLADGVLILQDGTKVTSDQIKQADAPSPNLLILHYNSVQCIKLIETNTKFVEYMSGSNNSTNSVIHIVERQLEDPTAVKILESQEFANFMKRFPMEVQHIVYNRDYINKDYDPCQEPVSRHIELVSFVNKYFPNCMPDILAQQYTHIKQHLSDNKFLEQLFPETKVTCYRRCHELVLAPKKSQGYFLMNDAAQERKDKDINKENKRDFIVPQNIINPMDIECSIPEEYNNFKQVDPKVVFLGTGSMKPSKYRNVSSIYVQMTPNHSILLDCGQGSYYQLFNHFGYQQIDSITLKTRIIFITHIHSDHNLGILDFIAERNKLLRRKYNRHSCSEQQYQEAIKNDKLFLIIPYNVVAWFDSYVQKVEYLLEGCEVLFVQTILGEPYESSNATVSKDQRIIEKVKRAASQMKDQRQEDSQACEQPNQELQAYYSPYMKQLMAQYSPIQPDIHKRFNQYLNNEMGVINFEPVHVDHCPQSFAIVIEHKSKVKISYSGDCRPSQQFAKAAYKSTLLIHEATFGDDLMNNAIENMHSTVGEAIDIAMSSQSWKLALTHFSQRYISAKQIVNPSIYKLDEKKKDYAQKHSIVCFDHLRMRMSELPVLTYQSRKISQIFPCDSQQ